MRYVLVCLTVMPGIAFAGSLRGGGDICAIRPDLCDGDDSSVAALARQAGRQPASTTVRRSRAAASARGVGRAAAASSITCRPSTVEVTPTNQDIPVCGSARGPASVTAAVSTASVDFNSYMNANAANPALARRVGNYQTAFASTAKAAAFVAPSMDGGGVREGDVGSPAPAAPAGRPN